LSQWPALVTNFSDSWLPESRVFASEVLEVDTKRSSLSIAAAVAAAVGAVILGAGAIAEARPYGGSDAMGGYGPGWMRGYGLDSTWR
jgi:hypothetical protein